jgi:hypothetical protein
MTCSHSSTFLPFTRTNGAANWPGCSHLVLRVRGRQHRELMVSHTRANKYEVVRGPGAPVLNVLMHSRHLFESTSRIYFTPVQCGHPRFLLRLLLQV